MYKYYYCCTCIPYSSTVVLLCSVFVIILHTGRLVCRCHDVFLWCHVCFVLLRFRLYAFVEAAALRSIYPSICRRPDSHTCFFFPFVYLEMPLFLSIFCTIAAFSLYGEYGSTSRTFFPSEWSGFSTTAYVRIQSINQVQITFKLVVLFYSSTWYSSTTQYFF